MTEADEAAHVVDGVDVDAVVAAVTRCAAVSGIAGGAFGGAMTLLPGRRVPGIRVGDGEVQVDVRARWGVAVGELDREVRAATTGLLAGHRLHVFVADIDDAPGVPALEPTFTRRPPAVAPPAAGTPSPAATLPVTADNAGDLEDRADRPSSPS